MNMETLKTLSLCSFFVSLFGTLGFLVAFLLNALTFYIEAPTPKMYETMVQTEILSITYIPYYLLASVLFAGLVIFVVYMMKEKMYIG